MQYCESKARELIEDCIMFIDPEKGYSEARALLKKNTESVMKLLVHASTTSQDEK